jgi:hypothetical protein
MHAATRSLLLQVAMTDHVAANRSAEATSVETASALDALNTIYGKDANKSDKSVWFAASPNNGDTPKISSNVRKVEPCV